MNVKAGDCAVMHLCSFVLPWKQAAAGDGHQKPCVISMSLMQNESNRDFIMLLIFTLTFFYPGFSVYGEADDALSLPSTGQK